MYLSLETSKKLKEMGCDVESEYVFNKYGERARKQENSKPVGELYPAYDLRDIICNGEMAKAFFGDYRSRLLIRGEKLYFGGFSHAERILSLLQQNKQEEAEAYLLEHCIFNK